MFTPGGAAAMAGDYARMKEERHPGVASKDPARSLREETAAAVYTGQPYSSTQPLPSMHCWWMARWLASACMAAPWL